MVDLEEEAPNSAQAGVGDVTLWRRDVKKRLTMGIAGQIDLAP